MAQKGTTTGQANPALSSRLMQLKFMQRRQNKVAVVPRRDEDPAPEEETNAEEKQSSTWVVGGETGCRLNVEPEPPPGTAMGRMAFKVKGADITDEQAQEETRPEKRHKS